jgi:hypothetical protein
MPARWTISLAALLSLTACSYDFERSSEVLDRRILAIQMEPPELSGGAPLPDSVQARALVVDPVDPAAIAEVSWRSCTFPARSNVPAGSGDDRLCTEGDDTVQHASGRMSLSSVSENIPLPESVASVLTAGEDVPAPQIQVQLEVSSEKGALVAVKEVTVTARLPEGQEPNRNPNLQGFTLDGTDWLPDSPRTLTYGDCPDEQKKGVEAEDGSLVPACEHEIEPLFDEAEAQFYEDRGFSGKPELQRERLRFSWFTDAGSFRRDITQQFDPRDPSPDNVGPKAFWREPPTKRERATLWIVVRDSRGGITWARREVLFQ